MSGICPDFLARLGIAVLAAVIFDGLTKVVCAFVPRRKIKISKSKTLRVVEIDSATNRDVDAALADNAKDGKEFTDD